MHAQICSSRSPAITPDSLVPHLPWNAGVCAGRTMILTIIVLLDYCWCLICRGNAIELC